MVECNLSTFTQVLYLSAVFRHLSLNVSLFEATLHLFSSTFTSQLGDSVHEYKLHY